MQKASKQQQAVTGREYIRSERTRQDHVGRVAFTPGEFAASFGRSETWGYRQLYSGRVKAIQVSGRLLIPQSEIDRLLSEAAVYNGCPTRAPKAKRTARSGGRPPEGDQLIK